MEAGDTASEEDFVQSRQDQDQSIYKVQSNIWNTESTDLSEFERICILEITHVLATVVTL